EDWWPLLALSVGLLVGGVSLGLQRMTFLGVFTDFLAVNSLPTVERDRHVFLPPMTLGAFSASKDPAYQALLPEANRLADLPEADREPAALSLLDRVVAAGKPPDIPNTTDPSALGVKPLNFDVFRLFASTVYSHLAADLRAYVRRLRESKAEREALD